MAFARMPSWSAALRRVAAVAARVLGIERGTGGRRLRLRGWFYIWAFLGASFVGVGGLTVYSTSPAFCRSCHIMEPYYKAWASSKHNNVACVECHYPPGTPRDMVWRKFQAMSQVVKYVTRTYSSKPFAEVEDASCLRGGCHSTRLLRGRVVSSKGVLFDHRPHLEGVRYGRRLRCVSCHSQIVVGKHIEVTWNTCYLCHLRGGLDAIPSPLRGDGLDTPPPPPASSGSVSGGGGASASPTGPEDRGVSRPPSDCLACHLLPSRPIQAGNITYSHKDFLAKKAVGCRNCHQDVVRGEGRVAEERCFACHNQPEKLARFKETAFIHDNHVTKHNTACIHCHEEIRHGATAAGTKTLAYDCSMCHTDMHDLQRGLYMGVGAKGVPPMPSPMYLANVDCVGCHIEELPKDPGASHAKTLVGSEKGCTECHGPEYRGILDDAHAVMRDAIAKVSEKAAAVRAAADARRDVPPDAARGIAEASANVELVRRAHGIHNIYYAAQVLRDADARLTAAAKPVGAVVQDLAALPIVSGAFCATLCHGKVGVDVPPKEPGRRQGWAVPHPEHLKGDVTCTACHVFGAHKDVKVRDGLDCLECHEREELDKHPAPPPPAPKKARPR